MIKIAESLNNWNLFIRERFSFVRHLTLLFFLFLANAFVGFRASKQPTFKYHFLCFCIIFLTFFRLRIFDEIKDYENDCVVHPNRPLARGLIQVSSAKKTAFFVMGIEIFLSLIIGFKAFVGAVFVSLYSLLMYKEFFISSWLKPKLATYALFHTLISSLISIFIFSCVTDKYFWQAPQEIFFFSIANWLIFNVFEFGRKTFGKDEEQKSIESYSKKFGSWGAALSIVFMALSATIIAWIISNQLIWPNLLLILLSLLFLILTTYSFLYAYFNSKKWAFRFRYACSAFILLYNVILSIGFLL